MFVIAVLVGIAGPAHADPPWAAGVAKDKQQQANALFAEANQLFAQQAHAPALAKYQAALALWDHPLIEFNTAVTLVRLDRILEAADAIDKALAYDAAPFPTQEQYQQALDYQKLVAGRVGWISATCTQPGATMSLDGKPWFTCPGTQRRRVLVGNHTVTGVATGFMPVSHDTLVVGNDDWSGTYNFLPITDTATLAYPSPRWLPWTVAGGGAAIALSGLGVWLAGRDQMDRFQQDYAVLCPMGCSAQLDANPVERQLADRRDAAHLKGNVGIGLMAGGGAVLAGGVVWAILNRPRRVLPNVEVAPTMNGASAAVSWRF
jgi:Tfp pilus assembly protein PilE